MNARVFRRLFTLACLLCSGIPLVSSARASRSGNDTNTVQAFLGEMVETALRHHPRLAGERARLAVRQAEREGLRGFFDPVWQAEGGRHDAYAGDAARLPADADALRAELRWPLTPGIYVNVGASERRFLNTLQGDPLYQTLLGAQVEIPLRRDRGFRLWRLRDRRAMELAWSSAFDVLSAAQEIHRDVMQAYIDWLHRDALGRSVDEALKRVILLLDETESRVALDAAPAYQLHAARMEVALRRDERRQFEADLHAAGARLRESLGMDPQPAWIQVAPGGLSRWAAAAAAAEPDLSLSSALTARGEVLSLQARLRAAEQSEALAAEALRADVALVGGAGYRNFRGDAEFDALGEADDGVGYEAALLWRQPLGRRDERAQLAARRAETHVLAESLRLLELRIERELSVAREQFRAAAERLDFVRAAVTEAERALAAEAERFQLGQGRNRDVLDAQIDLTNAVRRESAAAADLLRALTDWLYAAGQTGPRFTHSPAGEPNADTFLSERLRLSGE